MSGGWSCLAVGCKGRIRGVPTVLDNGQRRTVLFEGDEVSCPKCGAEYTVSVTDDYSDDCVASLVPVPADEKDGGR